MPFRRSYSQKKTREKEVDAVAMKAWSLLLLSLLLVAQQASCVRHRHSAALQDVSALRMKYGVDDTQMSVFDLLIKIEERIAATHNKLSTETEKRRATLISDRDAAFAAMANARDTAVAERRALGKSFVDPANATLSACNADLVATASKVAKLNASMPRLADLHRDALKVLATEQKNAHAEQFEAENVRADKMSQREAAYLSKGRSITDDIRTRRAEVNTGTSVALRVIQEQLKSLETIMEMVEELRAHRGGEFLNLPHRRAQTFPSFLPSLPARPPYRTLGLTRPLHRPPTHPRPLARAWTLAYACCASHGSARRRPACVAPLPLPCQVEWSPASTGCSARKCSTVGVQVECGKCVAVDPKSKMVVPLLGEGSVCAGATRQRTVPCASNPCPQDCVVSEWAFGPCSVNCGNGSMTATRRVLSPAMHKGEACPAKSSMHGIHMCRRHPCAPTRISTVSQDDQDDEDEEAKLLSESASIEPQAAATGSSGSSAATGTADAGPGPSPTGPFGSEGDSEGDSEGATGPVGFTGSTGATGGTSFATGGATSTTGPAGGSISLKAAQARMSNATAALHREKQVRAIKDAAESTKSNGMKQEAQDQLSR